MFRILILLIFTIKSFIIFSQNSSSETYIKDIEGQIYKTAVIGKQEWMIENLKVTKYNNGTTIPNIIDSLQWTKLKSGAWVYYKNDTLNNSKYGKLYNWYTLDSKTNGNKNVCPLGWHVPTDIEWGVLITYLGGDSLAGGRMKSVDTSNWESPNTDATNSSLFNGLPAGGRNNSGYFYYVGKHGYWWSSSETDKYNAWNCFLNNLNGEVARFSNYKVLGLSVRCLKD